MLSRYLSLPSRAFQSLRHFSHHTGVDGKLLVGRHKSRGQISTPNNSPGLLKEIINDFQNSGINIFNVDGRVLEKKDNGEEVCLFKISFDNSDPAEVEKISSKLSKKGFSLKIQEPNEVHWFPTSIDNLNELKKRKDHIDLVDIDEAEKLNKKGGHKFKQRRNQILKHLENHKVNDPVPDFDWEVHEKAHWVDHYKEVEPFRQTHGTSDFNENFNLLEKRGLLTANKIPEIEKINKFIHEVSNWRIMPVGHTLSYREFFNALAFRTFCLNHFFKGPEELSLGEDSDILHHLMGHIPNLLSPELGEISQILGQLSLGATDPQIQEIASIYWFLMEYGVLEEGGKLQFFGAAYSAYPDRIKFMRKIAEEAEQRTQPLQKMSSDAPNLEYNFVMTRPIMQISGSLSEYLEQVQRYAASFYKPFKVRYNFGNDSYDIDRALILVKPEALSKTVRGGVCPHDLTRKFFNQQKGHETMG